MKVISFVSQKGGSGKTTLSVHTAVAAHERGLKTVVIDTDPQASASVWSKARTKETPAAAACVADHIKRALAAAAREGYDLAVVDAAPHLDPNVAYVAEASDLIMIPVRPTPLDLHAAHRAANVARASGRPFGFVVNACPARSAELPETISILEGLDGVGVSPVVIGQRTAFARAIGSGQAVTEFEADGKAADEIRGLWDWIAARVGLPANGTGERQ